MISKNYCSQSISLLYITKDPIYIWNIYIGDILDIYEIYTYIYIGNIYDIYSEPSIRISWSCWYDEFHTG